MRALVIATLATLIVKQHREAAVLRSNLEKSPIDLDEAQVDRLTSLSGRAQENRLQATAMIGSGPERAAKVSGSCR